jgi:hypothetical protein
MTMVEGISGAQSMSWQTVGKQSLVHFAVVQTVGNLTDMAGKNSDSWMLWVEERKPRSLKLVEGKSTVRLAEQRSVVVIAWFLKGVKLVIWDCGGLPNKEAVVIETRAVAMNQCGSKGVVGEVRGMMNAPRTDSWDARMDLRDLEYR